jgi:hypothetical protein
MMTAHPRRIPHVTALVTATLAWSCASPAPQVGRPVLRGVEDEGGADDPVDGDAVCEVVGRSDLAGRADVEAPALARAADGLAAAWVAREDGRRVIRVQRLSPRLEPLGPPLDVDPGGEAPLGLGLATCGGRLELAWQASEPEGSAIRFATLSLDGPSPTALRAGVVAASGVQPALGCAGSTAAIAWSLRDQGVQDVFVRWLGPDGALSEPARVSGDTEAASDPAVACGTEACVVVWSDRREVYPEVFAAVVEAGAASGEREATLRVSAHDQTVSAAGGAYAPDLSPLGDDPEEFLVAWHDTRSGDESEVYAAAFSSRGRAGMAQRVSRSPASSSLAAAAACDHDRGAIAWRDRRRGPTGVVVAGVDGRGRRRTAAIALSGDTDEASAPAAACAGPEGYAVAWTEDAAEGAGGTLRLALVACR